MTNAKKEFLRGVREKKVKCAYLYYDNMDEYKRYSNEEYKEKGKERILKVWYSQQEYDDFLKSIDFDYDSGYWLQQLFGYVWFEDWTWLERWEYDGSEWREHKVCPEIPDQLK